MPHNKIASLLPYLDKSSLEEVTSQIIVQVGMTPIKRLRVPPPVDGTPWDDCFQRGLDRINALGQAALNAPEPKPPIH